MTEEEFINNQLQALSKSKFRSGFKLKEKEKEYIKEKGLDTIEKHAYDFIRQRLAPKEIINDGKQTPMKGHPVFIAQHATATCCRGCFNNGMDKKTTIINNRIESRNKKMIQGKKSVPKSRPDRLQIPVSPNLDKEGKCH